MLIDSKCAYSQNKMIGLGVSLCIALVARGAVRICPRGLTIGLCPSKNKRPRAALFGGLLHGCLFLKAGPAVRIPADGPQPAVKNE